MKEDLKEELRDILFDSIVNSLQEESLRKLVKPAQKQAVLDALETSVEEIDNNHVRMTFLFLTLDLDLTDETNPKMNMSFDLAKLKEYT